MYKKIYLFIMLFSQIFAGDPIISNWYIGTRVSGGGPYNHYMEIVNPTVSPINLSEYAIIKGHGQDNAFGTGWGNELENSGESFFRFPDVILFPGQTYSISRDVSHLSLQSAADTVLNGDCILGVSGDDAVGLFKSTGINIQEVLAATDSIPIDAIGTPYYDPGTSWQISGELGPVNSTGTSYYGVTRFAIVQRKSSVCRGNEGNWEISRGCFEEDCDNDSLATAYELSDWKIIACHFPDEDGNIGPGFEPENPDAAVDVDSMDAYMCDCPYDGENQNPEASAGQDQTVEIGEQFSLDGSLSSDADGSIQTHYWVQISGEKVQITSPAQSEIFLSAPDSLDTLVFVLHVIDNGFARDRDTVQIFIEEEVTADISNNIGKITEEFLLLGNWPNPFNSSTTISFNIFEPGNVNLIIYDIKGKKITEMILGFVESGMHNVYWNGMDFRGADCSSGIYIYELRKNESSIFRKMSFLK
ncbi:MAG: hypothetical protein CMG74_06570 [Candidatus Marinimicrobia bacterium]|nr:hypothetical protein [Candidatus Neomarinimicrobiota bacterium]|tara:strand:- start:283 stop:1701 length:1419 start_codon:yes stop_codon:yes gene_type:complete